MARRLTSHRTLLTAVLATVLVAAAISGVGAAHRVGSQGLHAPRVADQLLSHKVGDVHVAVTQRTTPDGGQPGVAAGSALAGPVAFTLSTPRAPGDWRKLSSGLVPLPLRI